MQQRVAVKAVIIEDGKCLLVKKAAAHADRQFGLWEIPGGKVEIGEPLIDALHREIKEELGIGIEIHQPIAAWDFIQSDDVQLIGITFLAEPLGSDVTLSAEHTAYVWLDERDIASADLHESLRAEVLKGFQAVRAGS